MKSLAIRKAHPEVVNILCDNDSVWSAWDEKGTEIKLDEELIKIELEKLQAAYDLLEYQRKRKPEYPKIEDQLDLLYHEGIEGWKKEIQKVKDKYPKPEAPSE